MGTGREGLEIHDPSQFVHDFDHVVVRRLEVIRGQLHRLIALECVDLAVAWRQVTNKGWLDGVCQWRERPSDWLDGCSVGNTCAAHATPSE